MSRAQSIIDLAKAVTAAETALSEEIDRVFYTGRIVEYQTGYSENDSSWEKYEVCGPFDWTTFVIKKAGCVADQPSYEHRISALSSRLRLPKGEKT